MNTSTTKTAALLAAYALGLVLGLVPGWGVYAGAACCAGATLVAVRAGL